MTAAMGPKAKGDAVAAVPVPVDATDTERRRAPRVLVDLEVDCASEDNYLFAYITDISATGIFVRTTTPEQLGTHLNLRLSADEDERIEAEGEVIWVNPYRPGTPDNLHPGMGIRFVNLDNEMRDRLFELIRRFAYLS
jgi:uncharacterized protein (TIGR02266 family)